MADFDAPPGPPPPKVPEGWIVKWNDQYKEWFYVNSYTRKSQWDKPTAPAPRPDDHDGPEGPPPSYTPGKNPTAASDTKSAAGTTNPFETSKTGGSSSTSHQQEEEDARLARQMQEEENARAHSPQPGSGAAASYASTPVPGSGSSPYGSDPQLPPRPDDGRGGGSRGLLGKLFGGKNKMSSQQQGYGGGYPGQQPYGSGGYGSPQPQYGAYPPQGYGGPGYGGYGPGPGYGGPPPGGYYGGGGGYPQQQQQQARPSRMGGGMGMAGGAALGLGAGLVGGMLLEDAIDHHDQQIYNEGYQNGDMGDGGGDYGGDGGGDYGGDGGGDFGGGDF